MLEEKYVILNQLEKWRVAEQDYGLTGNFTDFGL